MKDMILTIPAVALRGMTILPGMVAHFDVSREKSIQAVQEAMMGEQQIFLITQRNVEVDNPGPEDLYQIGIIADIKQVIKMQNNIVRILVEGKERAELGSFAQTEPYILAEIFKFEEESQKEESPEVKEGMLRAVQETYAQYAALNPKQNKDFARQVAESRQLEHLMDMIANNIPIQNGSKQKIQSHSLRN